EAGNSHRFTHAQCRNSIINAALEGMFRDLVSGQIKPVRQVRIGFSVLSRLDTQPTLWGTTDGERLGALDNATLRLNRRLGKNAVMTGAELALRKLDTAHANPKAKCPFVPQREMVRKLWGTDADPLANKGEWEKRLGQLSKQAQYKH
ncbi:MAG TPA: hypothetical protein VHH73_18050, partial [Verrucomicrobiae bacterium]|nr:hypothetical protein [Verrucomicrobiae bacterium]